MGSPDTKDLPELIAHESAGWESIELQATERIRYEIISPQLNSKLLYVKSIYGYGESQGGGRYLLVDHVFADGKINREAYYYDGQKGANVRYDLIDPSIQKNVGIFQGFANEGAIGHTERPLPLRFYYVGKVPLLQALSDGQILEDAPVGDELCARILFRDVKWSRTPQSLVYYVSLSKGIPLRVDSVSNPDDLDAQALWSWQADSVDKRSGHFIVVKSHMTTYDLSPGAAKDTVRFVLESDLASVTFNSKTIEGRFWPSIQPGVQVVDSIRHISYITPGQGKLAVQKAPGTVVAPPPADRPHNIVFSVSVALILCGIAMLAWLMKRRA